MDASAAPLPLLSVRDLAVRMATEEGAVHAVSGVSFDVPAGRTVALVGESGCGKTSVALSILRLHGRSASVTMRGSVLFRGRDLLALPEGEMRRVRGGEIGMIFQDPLAALNPVHTIGAQIAEAVLVHEPVSRRAARARAADMLRRAGFPRPEERMDSYPHELSGGMRQRVLIAMALVAKPALLVADEPTSALDATVQVEILELLEHLRSELDMSLLLIAHDLALVSEIAHEVVVLYAGVVVETGPPSRILREPRHPYTKALVRSIPPDGVFRSRGERRPPLPVIQGTLPDPRRPPPGCRFQGRCDVAIERCKSEPPPLFTPGGGPGMVRCLLHDPGAPRTPGDLS